MTPREELIQIQRRLVRDLKREIYDSLYGDCPNLREYASSYNKHFEGPVEVASKDELLDRVEVSDIVYHGDFHTLKRAQLSPIKILREIAGRGRPVCLALEMFCSGDQIWLDRFQRMEITEDAFLEAVQYESAWGFDWNNYRNLVYFALANDIPLFALDCRDFSDYVPLDIRDVYAAERIVERRRTHPDELLYVFAGELHIAPDHLPAAVDLMLDEPRPRRTILYQNNETVYWNLAERGEQEAGLVRLADDQFCLMNCTPLVVYQSYRNWAERQEELAHADEDWWDESHNSLDVSEQVHQLVEIIAEFLDVDASDFDDFTVQLPHDLDGLELVQSRFGLSEERVAELIAAIGTAKSLYIPEARIIYLTNLSLNRAAEEAARFVHHQMTERSRPAPTPRDAFYAEAMREALGFFGSKIVNHKRSARRDADYARIERNLRNRRLGPEEARQLAIARHFLSHKRHERDVLDARMPTRRPGRLYKLATAMRRSVTSALGHILGDDLYAAMLADRFSKSEASALFATDFDAPGIAEQTYFDLAILFADSISDTPNSRATVEKPSTRPGIRRPLRRDMDTRRGSR